MGYLKTNENTVQHIKDSLNIEVLKRSEYEDNIHELWQVIGYQIDSLIKQYEQDTLFTFAEKAVDIQYESIKDESPLEYYPLHVGDKWRYSVQSKIGDNDTSYYLTREIVGRDSCNGIEYFLLSDGMIDCYRYIRIDSVNATVLEKLCREEPECMIDSLEMIPGKWFLNDCCGFVYCTAETTKVVFDKSRNIKAFQWNAPITCVYSPYRDYEYAQGIGLIYSKYVHPSPADPENERRIMNLVYAKINGTEYGDTSLVSVDNNELNTLPLEFSLSQNYPNPFNPSTTIKYTIPFVETGHPANAGQVTPSVRLVIYDILGREVTTLVNKVQQPGSYEVKWDASNKPSSVYYYQLKAGGFVKTKKMILLK